MLKFKCNFLSLWSWIRVTSATRSCKCQFDVGQNTKEGSSFLMQKGSLNNERTTAFQSWLHNNNMPDVSILWPPMFLLYWIQNSTLSWLWEILLLLWLCGMQIAPLLPRCSSIQFIVMGGKKFGKKWYNFIPFPRFFKNGSYILLFSLKNAPY